MRFLDLANQLIPGYTLLDTDIRAAFENTDSGSELHMVFGQIKAMTYQENKHKSYIAQFVDWFLEEEPDMHAAIDAAKRRFILYCEHRPEYQHIIQKISQAVQTNQAQARTNAIDKLHTRYTSSEQKESSFIVVEEQKQLTIYLLICLSSACNNQINTLNLADFNAKQAAILAKQILEAFKDNHPVSVDQWLHAYEKELSTTLKDKLGNAELYIGTPHATNQNVTGMLSSLLSNSIGEENKQRLYEKLNQTADAHAFIQKTGFATQNETSYLSWLDVYNYHRASESIVGAKHALFKFFQPFSSLFAEYKDITYKEKSIARQMVRTFIPMFIVSAVIISVAALLSTIFIPEIAFGLLLIPTLYVGLILANTYVEIKDSVYHLLRQVYYGGQYAIPEHQVNERMCRGLGGLLNAQTIREYYIDEIKLCYENETTYSQKALGTLTVDELKERTENAHRKDMLRLEWYDIHSNADVGCNLIPLIVANRFQLDAIKVCKPIKQTLKTELPLLVKNIGQEIKTTLENNGTRVIAPGCHQFFPCLAHYQKATHLLQLSAKLRHPDEQERSTPAVSQHLTP